MKNVDIFRDALHPQIKPGLPPILPLSKRDPLPLPKQCLLLLISFRDLWLAFFFFFFFSSPLVRG